MKKLIFGAILLFVLGMDLSSQSFYFSPKGGLHLGIQNWGGFERRVLPGLQGAIALETFNERGPGSFYMQLGYHQRGSSENSLFVLGGGNAFIRRQGFQFNNASFTLGAKRHMGQSYNDGPYYGFGLRLEYTLSTNLNQYQQFAGYFPIDPFVNKFNYGADVVFGYDYRLSELIGVVIEATLAPDLSFQYQQPFLGNIISPINGQTISIREQQIRNISFQLSLGFRFLRKVIYLDDY